MNFVKKHILKNFDEDILHDICLNVEKTSLTSKQTELSRSHVQKKETKNVPLVIIAFTIEWVNSFICSVICLKCWFFNQNAKFRTSNP